VRARPLIPPLRFDACRIPACSAALEIRSRRPLNAWLPGRTCASGLVAISGLYLEGPCVESEPCLCKAVAAAATTAWPQSPISMRGGWPMASAKSEPDLHLVLVISQPAHDKRTREDDAIACRSCGLLTSNARSILPGRRRREKTAPDAELAGPQACSNPCSGKADHPVWMDGESGCAASARLRAPRSSPGPAGCGLLPGTLASAV